MRSDLVFGATKQVSNRFLLTKALATATRALHRPGSRIEDTTNGVLIRFCRANPITQGDAVPIAANLPSRGGRSLTATPHQFKRLNIPAVPERSHSSTGGLTATSRGRDAGLLKAVSSSL
jgi:hypothetical protein